MFKLLEKVAFKLREIYLLLRMSSSWLDKNKAKQLMKNASGTFHGVCKGSEVGKWVQRIEK